jgi:hypothetical protein
VRVAIIRGPGSFHSADRFTSYLCHYGRGFLEDSERIRFSKSQAIVAIDESMTFFPPGRAQISAQTR